MTRYEKQVVKNALAVYMERLQEEYDMIDKEDVDSLVNKRKEIDGCMIVSRIWDDILDSRCGTVTI